MFWFHNDSVSIRDVVFSRDFPSGEAEELIFSEALPFRNIQGIKIMVMLFIYIFALMLKPITRKGISSNINKKM